MIQSAAILLAVSLAQADGGIVDVPRHVEDLDAGVVWVDEARLPNDGGVVGPGYFLTSDRLAKVGVEVEVAKQCRQAQNQSSGQQSGQQSGSSGFWTGFGLGAGGVVVAVVVAFIWGSGRPSK